MGCVSSIETESGNKNDDEIMKERVPSSIMLDGILLPGAKCRCAHLHDYFSVEK